MPSLARALRSSFTQSPLPVGQAPVLTNVEWRLERSTAGIFPHLQRLWHADPSASPFAAPAFLRHRAAEPAEDGASVWFAHGTSGGRSVALWPLLLDRRGGLRFLQDDHADHCTCLAASGVDEERLGGGLAAALSELQPSHLVFKNVPPWGPTLGAIRSGLAQSGWYARAFPATACPVLKTESGSDALATFLHEINSHKRLRNYENRLKRLPGYAFEVLDDATDLKAWAHQFCDLHEWRWNRTDTPSRFGSTRAREELVQELTAWSADGVLRRFAIRVEGRRIALVAALVGGGRLVYHRPAAAPGWSETRPGHVLIRQIGLWMADAGLHVLDFGVGDEEYKGRYAQHDDTLWRVFASPRRLSLPLARGVIEERIRRNPAAQRRWDYWINGLVNAKLRRAVTDLRDGLGGQPRRWHGGPAAASKPEPHDEILYVAEGTRAAPTEPSRLCPVDTAELLSNPGFRRPNDRADLIERSYSGARLLGLVENGKPSVTAWLVEEPAGGEGVARGDQKSYRVVPETLATRDRRGLIGRFLEGVRSEVATGAAIFISVPRRSRALCDELTSAGFNPVKPSLQ